MADDLLDFNFSIFSAVNFDFWALFRPTFLSAQCRLKLSSLVKVLILVPKNKPGLHLKLDVSRNLSMTTPQKSVGLVAIDYFFRLATGKNNRIFLTLLREIHTKAGNCALNNL